MGAGKRILTLYHKLLKNHLILVQAVQTGLLVGSGDLMAQTVIERKPIKHINLVRTCRFFALGTVMIGPAVGLWYRFLTKTFGTPGPGDTAIVLKKVACDQLFFAPTFLLIFVSIINALEGHSWQKIKEQLKLKYPTILMTNYKIWPFVQLVNFYFVPLHHQVLFVQIISLFWNAYLSWKTEEGNTDK